MSNTPRLYVVDLREYADGTGLGGWYDLDCPEGVGDLLDRLEQINEQGNDWEVHDHEGFYGLDPMDLRMDQLTELAQEPDETREAICLWLAGTGYHKTDPDDWRDKFNEAYCGCYETVVDYATQLIDDCYDLEKMMGNLYMYFDYESYARDLELGGDISSYDGRHGVHVYNNHI